MRGAQGAGGAARGVAAAHAGRLGGGGLGRGAPLRSGHSGGAEGRAARSSHACDRGIRAVPRGGRRDRVTPAIGAFGRPGEAADSAPRPAPLRI